ncbi:MAG: DnaD domain protein [Clostridia bacterium]|nr:DnaD domain protein [Clostridia bacterium]
MGEITLSGNCTLDVTIVSNLFIDEYMRLANDAQIKIYLFLLRCMSSNMPVSVSIIADYFNYTEKDVLRALKYWEKTGILALEFDSSKNLIGIKLQDLNSKKSEHTAEVSSKETPAAILIEKPVSLQKELSFTPPEKPAYSADQLAVFREKKDISQLLFIAEQYIGKPLSIAEISTILYMYDSLHFSAELIEYLIEYCVSNKKKSMHYMEKVAVSWAEQGINDVATAKKNVSMYRKEVFDILKAMGLSGRNPVEPELVFIKKWTDTYGFDTQIIIEACNRTMKVTHRPNFEYADTILNNWKKNHVRHYADIEVLDQKFKSSKEKPAVTAKTGTKAATNQASNKFINFDQRSYDYSALEQDMLKK